MAVDDLDTLRQQLPEVFDDLRVPDAWDDEWFIVPIEEPDEGYRDDEAAGNRVPSIEQDATDQPLLNISAPERDFFYRDDRGDIPDFAIDRRFPGRPTRGGQYYPPPDAFAFYLPFHYFYPKWWGIYLVLEPTLKLSEFVRVHSDGKLTAMESLVATRIFLYAHEAFHHIVESFGTRLEISHRKPLYKEGFARLYERVYGSDECLEEAIATSHGIRRVKERAFPGNKVKAEAALGALRTFVESCPPGYRRALEFTAKASFDKGRFQFAEDNHREALNLSNKQPQLWAAFPHAFSGISRVTSRVNYLVRKDSALAQRLSLNLRYLRYRDLRERLIDLGECQFVREGKGGHEIWQSRHGHRFPIPRHPGDLRPGTLAKIIKEAGLDMSLSEFMAARA
jgi:predicted RNA binding protein YcfA (HicA-like mRNA interferase family)